MTTITLNAPLVHILVALVIPFATSLVTKSTASIRVKGAVTMILAAVAALIFQFTLPSGSAVLTQDVLIDWFIVTLTSVGSYVGILNPLANQRFNSLKALLPHRGLD
jgi:hypothetical protein